MAKAFGYLLPAAADTAAPTANFTYPAELSPVNPVDFVDVEVKAFDERGDISEVRLYAGNELVKTKRSFPFQFRFWPKAAQVGSTLTLRAEAEDKAGNVKTITRDVRVVSAQALVQSPLPVGAKPVLTGSPTVGAALTVTGFSFINNPAYTRYEWLRDGDVIAEAARATYTLTTADLGHLVSARVTAGNSDGEGDVTTKGLYVSAAAAGDGSQGPAGRRRATRAPPVRPGPPARSVRRARPGPPARRAPAARPARRATRVRRARRAIRPTSASAASWPATAARSPARSRRSRRRPSRRSSRAPPGWRAPRRPAAGAARTA